jgi:hypothetical protein
VWVGFTGVGVELERGEAHLGGTLEAAEEELELPRRGHLGRQEDATGGGGFFFFAFVETGLVGFLARVLVGLCGFFRLRVAAAGGRGSAGDIPAWVGSVAAAVLLLGF